MNRVKTEPIMLRTANNLIGHVRIRVTLGLKNNARKLAKPANLQAQNIEFLMYFIVIMLQTALHHIFNKMMITIPFILRFIKVNLYF